MKPVGEIKLWWRAFKNRPQPLTIKEKLAKVRESQKGLNDRLIFELKLVEDELINAIEKAGLESGSVNDSD